MRKEKGTANRDVVYSIPTHAFYQRVSIYSSTPLKRFNFKTSTFLCSSLRSGFPTCLSQTLKTHAGSFLKSVTLWMTRSVPVGYSMRQHLVESCMNMSSDGMNVRWEREQPCLWMDVCVLGLNKPEI